MLRQTVYAFSMLYYAHFEDYLRLEKMNFLLLNTTVNTTTAKSCV